jgi:hypothetical protein
MEHAQLTRQPGTAYLGRCLTNKDKEEELISSSLARL